MYLLSSLTSWRTRSKTLISYSSVPELKKRRRRFMNASLGGVTGVGYLALIATFKMSYFILVLVDLINVCSCAKPYLSLCFAFSKRLSISYNYITCVLLFFVIFFTYRVKSIDVFLRFSAVITSTDYSSLKLESCFVI